MRKITKQAEPKPLTSWKKRNPGQGYEKLDHSVRLAIRQACIEEQFGLCAYCCKRIDERNSVNEHLVARHLDPSLSLDYTNLVASCSTRGQCDNAHGSRPLPLTPLMEECETELRFRLSGKIEELTARAGETIRVLGLDNRVLQEIRKQMIDCLIFEFGSRPDEITLLTPGTDGDHARRDLPGRCQPTVTPVCTGIG